MSSPGSDYGGYSPVASGEAGLGGAPGRGPAVCMLQEEDIAPDDLAKVNVLIEAKEQERS
jgi:hypothetical protein